MPCGVVRFAFAPLALVITSAACGSLPPAGEVLVIVDTDLPTPLGNRLRIDLYRPDGIWYASRDYPISNLEGWPASFGIVSDDPNNATEVYARLRVYPDGQTRDYLGERYHDSAPMTPAFVPQNVNDMCTNAMALPLGGIVVGRRGQHAFVPMLSGDDCTYYNFANQTGTFAAYVDIPATGSYEFGILASAPGNDRPASLGQPPLFPFQQATLQLRHTCADDASFIGCDPGWGSATSAPDGNPRITAPSLAAGSRVYVIVGGIDAAAGPLEVAVAAWKSGSPPPSGDQLPASPGPSVIPLSLESGATPASEPEPGVTVDRLVRLSIPPAEVMAARITLAGACLGTMSKLGDQTIDLSNAQSCTDANIPLSLVTPLPLDSDLTQPPALARTFGVATPCPPPVSTSSHVCVEGGAFILGGRNTVNSYPVRTVAVSTFWIDRYETTVGDYRASKLPADSVDGPLGLVNGVDVGCTYSPSPGAIERFPLVCLSWDRAEQYCQSQHGELATEAQWEYAATVAGRQSKALFAWGDDPPQCACDGSSSPCHAPLFGRNLPGTPLEDCSTLPDKLEPVDSRSDPTTGDVTALGIVGMTGSVIEWVRDSAWPYASPCWYSASVIDPVCTDDNALLRSERGGGWTSNISPLVAHAGVPPRESGAGLGLRCVYPP